MLKRTSVEPVDPLHQKPLPWAVVGVGSHQWVVVSPVGSELPSTLTIMQTTYKLELVSYLDQPVAPNRGQILVVHTSGSPPELRSGFLVTSTAACGLRHLALSEFNPIIRRLLVAYSDRF